MKTFNLTRIGYYADFVLMPVFVIVLLVLQLGLVFLVAIIVGFAAWTLAEYLIHRFILHRVALLRREHDRHHASPADYIGVGSVFTLPILAALWLVLRWAFADIGDGATLGLVGGYVAYIVVHDRFHHGDLRPGELLYRAHHRHALHHRGADFNFGVSVPWWDVVFRTYRR